MQVIFDNGGGITLQTTTFAALYSDPVVAATDAMLLVSGVDPDGWMSYEEDRISQEDIAAGVCGGGYRVVGASEVLEAMNACQRIDDGVFSWRNQQKFFSTLRCVSETDV